MSKRVVVIGGGFGGLSAACYLAKSGHDVTVLEKNEQVGGRAMVGRIDVSGHGQFVFDRGPSWYMMPDVFEEFFADFGKKPSDYFELVKLDPSYKIFTESQSYDVQDATRVYKLFEKLEPGSSKQLQKLLAKTKYEYEVVRRDLLTSPMLSVGDTLNKTALKMLSNPVLLGSYHNRIQKYIKHPDLQKILEFMVVFMGGSPKNIPALYTLLTHVDMGLGIWYPLGGMGKLAEAMYQSATELGVKFELNADVISINVERGHVKSVQTDTQKYDCDIVVANADYHHVETKLLAKQYITQKWAKKVTSPSGLLVYLGVSKKLKNLRHHNMFFDVDWDAHFVEVFDQKVWSNEPMFYVGAPSVTDYRVAPKGYENIFVLAPMAAGNEPEQSIIDKTVDSIIGRMEKCLGESFKNEIVYKEVKAQNYFKGAFHAYKGNAFGLAHTLKQSAIFRPPIKHPKVEGLYFAGQYSNPGTGVPIVTLSGKVISTLIG